MYIYVQSVTLLLLSIIPLPVSPSVAKLPHCVDNKEQGLVLVNTLDGKLTVLNDVGKELWSMETGPGPMLSSSIDRLELTNNGHWVRIIPSLAGSLYKFDGDTIDAIPITADNLLTASFRYSDDLVIAGGKEIRTYGVTLHSGKVLYECTITGCKNKTGNEEYEDLILVERNTQTVRAVEPRFGAERWNFSVGQLNIKLPQISCHSDGENKLKFTLKSVVPEGLIYALSETNEVLWKKQFDTPIVNVWTWDGHRLNQVNLFISTQYSWANTHVNNNLSPALYVGMHNKQLYIHESDMMKKFLNSNNYKDHRQLTEMKSVSQIPWKPFQATSSALTIVDSEQTDFEEAENPSQISTTALSVLYASEYVNGNGYYLYTAETKNSQCENTSIEIIEDELVDNDDEVEAPVEIIIVSLWYWWKEIVCIIILTAITVIYTPGLLHRKPAPEVIVIERHVSMNHVKVDSPNRTISESSDKEFTSRYLSDFDPLRCLGKGGFGIVYEVRNKIDECNYAVKRITLPDKLESRQRVMREVKTLAKLDHRNIVRYFNAWLERPPPEWINTYEHEWKKDVISSDDFEYSTTRTPLKKVSSSVVIDFNHDDINKYNTVENLKRSERVDSDSFIVFASGSVNESVNFTDNDISFPENSLHTTTYASDRRQSSAVSLLPPPFDSGKVFLYIQMQLCRKESLKDWLKDNLQRRNQDVINIFDQIVSAVEYVHCKGLIHRDLKPSNIFFSIEGEIKVGDFGLVTAMEECAEEEENYNEIDRDKKGKHTKAVGTQLYMSPEQLKGQSYNFKVDIYSLGVILFELLVSFHTAMERNKTLTDLRKNIFPAKFCKEFQKEYELLSLMLSENPEKRPTSSEIRGSLPLENSDNCDFQIELSLKQHNGI